MQKLIYLAKRKPGFSFDEFVCRWRKHGAFAMGRPIWRHAIGYVQAEPIRPVPIPGASEEFDAVACYMIRDAILEGKVDLRSWLGEGIGLSGVADALERMSDTAEPIRRVVDPSRL